MKRKKRKTNTDRLETLFLRERDKHLQTLWSEVSDMVELHQELRELAGKIEAFRQIRALETLLETREPAVCR